MMEEEAGATGACLLIAPPFGTICPNWKARCVTLGQQQGKVRLTIAYCTFLMSAVTISRKVRMMEEEAGMMAKIDTGREYLAPIV
jgi:hypothetical protein